MFGSDGFSKRKDRESDQRDFWNVWRESWAMVQNRAIQECNEEKMRKRDRNRERSIEVELSR